MDKKIYVIVNEGGVVEEVKATKDLKDVDVEIIDFCTQDPAEIDDANDRYDEMAKLKNIVDIL